MSQNRTLRIKLKSKPLSVNAMYYANRRQGLTAAAKEWQCNIFQQLANYETQIKALRESLDPKTQGYSIKVDYIFPKEVLYTKEGSASSKAMDLSNCDKALIDCIFLPSHCGDNVPYQCQNLNIDDKHLFELSSRKLPGLENEIRLEISLIDLPTL